MPLPFLSGAMHFQTSLPANPAAQKPLAQPADVHQHVLVGLFHLGHGVGVQTQLFSDKVSSITTLSAMDSANDRLRLRSRHSYPST
jgi:hypothetical protein